MMCLWECAYVRFGFLFEYDYIICTACQVKEIFGMENWTRFIVNKSIRWWTIINVFKEALYICVFQKYEITVKSVITSSLNT